jgi:phospholipase D1/2
MAIDSEINIAATHPSEIGELRERIFRLHSGDTIRGSGIREELPDIFKAWNKLMDHNLLARKNGEALQGFLLPFEDHREGKTRVADANVPAADSALALA